MIRTERTQIGLLEAFGNSDAVVAWHYLKFALAIALLAAVLGTLGGAWMGQAITGLRAEYYRFPILVCRISPTVFLGAVALSLGVTVGNRQLPREGVASPSIGTGQKLGGGLPGRAAPAARVRLPDRLEKLTEYFATSG